MDRTSFRRTEEGQADLNKRAMQLFVPKETGRSESRCAIVPSDVKRLSELGISVVVESGAGELSDYPDGAYEEAGARLASDPRDSHSAADITLRISTPEIHEIGAMKPGAIHIGFLDPFNQPDLLKAFKEAGASAISMEMMPRSTLAQRMDALSSQANLAGYCAVINASHRLRKVVPMMMTPAGTIVPARFFIVGVGVAGLQAIATAKRLGARVEAFDTRPSVEEEVRSLGAKFIRIDLGDTGQTEQGYARQLTAEQIELQRREMSRICAYSDVVITTAKLFGRKAPRIITGPMLEGMRTGSVVIDLAVDSGGNVEGSRSGEEVLTANGIRIIGIGSLEGQVSYHASQVYSSNLTSLIEHCWNSERGTFNFDLEDEILLGCLLTHRGEIVHPSFK